MAERQRAGWKKREMLAFSRQVKAGRAMLPTGQKNKAKGPKGNRDV
jgi:hypothetical protein